MANGNVRQIVQPPTPIYMCPDFDVAGDFAAAALTGEAFDVEALATSVSPCFRHERAVPPRFAAIMLSDGGGKVQLVRSAASAACVRCAGQVDFGLFPRGDFP